LKAAERRSQRKQQKSMNEGISRSVDQDPQLETELTNRGVGWAIAVVVACVAGLGLALLFVVFTFFVLREGNLDLPMWVVVVGSVVVALCTLAFAWLVATAIERSRNSNQQPSRNRSDVTPFRRRSRT
jgi:protein-S-isoprenylcysteine O-methyltransferase Ste14